MSTVLLAVMGCSAYAAIAYGTSGWPRTAAAMTAVAVASAAAYAATGGPL